jgi:hypothetical protein
VEIQCVIGSRCERLLIWKTGAWRSRQPAASLRGSKKLGAPPVRKLVAAVNARALHGHVIVDLSYEEAKLVMVNFILWPPRTGNSCECRVSVRRQRPPNRTCWTRCCWPLVGRPSRIDRCAASRHASTPAPVAASAKFKRSDALMIRPPRRPKLSRSIVQELRVRFFSAIASVRRR